MFGPNFFPTPGRVAAKMLACVSKDAVNFLEPSAGKGDLAKAILGAGRHRGWSDKSAHRVDVIESDPDLVEILRANPELSVVGYDWLTYDGVSYYDAILMNPPFDEGARHALRAWDFLHAGEIVCLLNQETIDNPCTEERQRLATIIAAHGRVESLGQCFRDAERASDVSVAMVYLKKDSVDDRIEVWSTATDEREVDDGIGSPEALPARIDKLGNLEHYYNQALAEMFKAFAHARKAKLFMEALGADLRGDGNRSYDSDIKTIFGVALGNTTAARAEFTRALRRGAWAHVFEQMEFRKWLDTKQTDELMRDVERNSTIAFTASNVKGTLENVFLQRQKLFEQSVWNVFEALTKHYKGNTHGGGGAVAGETGWKSNDSFKVNRKLVFPYGCRYSYGSFDLWSTRDAGAIYTDLDRVLSVLDAKKFEDVATVAGALQASFKRSKEPGTCESTYFHIRYFKKGTVHLTWKRLDLLEAFAVTAARGRKWIGQQTA